MSRALVPWDLDTPEHRDYFDRWGDGLVVVFPPERAGGAYRGPPHGGAWLHVGTDGKVRAATGKVDVGQGTREALAMLVSEELRVSPQSVEVVMGDTEVCPWDVGTYGSRSMPDAGERIRRTGAAAREALVRLARERLNASPDESVDVVGEGLLRASVSGASVSYVDLLRGARRVETVPPSSQPISASEWRQAGRPNGRLRPSEVVTGARRYASDVQLPDMVHGKVLYPPAFGARLRRVDSQQAEAVPGVRVVRDGEFVGVVAANSLDADMARGLLQAEWEFASQPSERETPDYLAHHPVEGEDAWDVVHHEVGDFESAFQKSPVHLEQRYEAAYIAHIPMETRCAVADWSNHRLTVWIGTQTPFRLRATLARALGLKEPQVRVLVPPTGSGFGGKGGPDVALDAARLAKAVGRPVRVALTRSEEFTQGYFRPMAIIDVRSAASSEGSLVGWKMQTLNAGASAARTPYEVPNQRIDNQPSLSPLPQGPYRALAATANNFARESHMDEVAHQLGVDPLEFRLRHLTDARLSAVLLRVAERAGWGTRTKAQGRGYGLALGIEKGARVATVAQVQVSTSRRLEIERVVTGIECGAVVHPENLKSQVQGATVMALGGALFEALHYEQGRLLNPRFSQYRVPRFEDVPTIDVEIVDRPDLPLAGAGETPMIAVAPAVANAIFDATGRRLRGLPLVPTGRVP